MRKMILILLAMLLCSGCAAKEAEPLPEFVGTRVHHEFLDNGVVTGTDDFHYIFNGQGLAVKELRYQDGVLFSEADWEYDAFGNPVRITREENGTVQVSEFKNTLDEAGRILRQEEYLDGGLLAEYTHTYDKNGNELTYSSIIYHETEEASWREYTMTYDWKGNLTSKVLHWNFNGEYFVWEYEDDLCIRQTSYETDTDKILEYWEYTYDEKDRCIRESRYAEDGTLELYHEYVYDDTAWTKTRTSYDADGAVRNVSDVFTYDEYGNQIMQERCEDGEVYWRIQNTYELLETLTEGG